MAYTLDKNNNYNKGGNDHSDINYADILKHSRVGMGSISGDRGRVNYEQNTAPIFGGNTPMFASEDQTTIDENKAQDQSAIGSIGYGIGRLLPLVGTKFATGLSDLGGFALETANAISSDHDFDFNAAAHNLASDMFAGWEEALKQSMPVYNTQQDQSHNFLRRAATDLDFWTNDMADGAAFIGASWLTGMGASALLGNTSKALYAKRALEAAGDLQKTDFLSSVMGKIATGTEKYAAATVSRGVESLAEGKQSYDDVFSRTGDKDLAGSAAMTVAGLNMLLIPLEHMQMSNWMDTYSTAKNRFLKKTTEGLDIISVKQLARQEFLKQGFSEGIVEEGLQNAFQEYTKNRATDKTYTDDALTGSIKEYLKGFTTKQGWDAMGAGIILGGLFGGSSALTKGAKDEYKEAELLKKAVDNSDYAKNIKNYVINDASGKPIINKDKILADIKTSVTFKKLEVAKQNALLNNYEEAYKTLDNVQFANWIHSNLRVGNEEKVFQQIDAISNLSPEELKAQGYNISELKNSEGKIVSPKELANRYRAKAIELQNTYNDIEGRFIYHNIKDKSTLFSESVLQKELGISLDKINSKIAKAQLEIISRTEQAFGEEGSLPQGDLTVQELERFNKQKNDLSKTLKDSYKRVEQITNPQYQEKIEKELTNKEEGKPTKDEKVAQQISKDIEEKAKKTKDFVDKFKEGSFVHFKKDGVEIIGQILKNNKGEKVIQTKNGPSYILSGEVNTEVYNNIREVTPQEVTHFQLKDEREKNSKDDIEVLPHEEATRSREDNIEASKKGNIKSTRFSSAGKDVAQDSKGNDIYDDANNLVFENNSVFQPFFDYFRKVENTPGINGVYDIKVELDEEFNRKNNLSSDNVEQTALIGKIYKDGIPLIDENGKQVITSIHLPSYEAINNKGLTEEQIKQKEEEFREFRQSAIDWIKAGQSVYTRVINKSNGHFNLVPGKNGKRFHGKILGNLTDNAKTFIHNLFISVSTENNPIPSIVVNNQVITVPNNGKVYTMIPSANGTPIPLELVNRLLTDSEVDVIEFLLRKIANNPKAKLEVGKDKILIHQLLKNLIYLNKTDSKTSIYFEEGKLYYGDTVIDNLTDFETNGSQQLKEWLSVVKPHNISAKRLQEDRKDLSNKKSITFIKPIKIEDNKVIAYDVFGSYAEYLIGANPIVKDAKHSFGNPSILGTDLIDNKTGKRFVQPYLNFNTQIAFTPASDIEIKQALSIDLNAAKEAKQEAAKKSLESLLKATPEEKEISEENKQPIKEASLLRSALEQKDAELIIERKINGKLQKIYIKQTGPNLVAKRMTTDGIEEKEIKQGAKDLLTLLSPFTQKDIDSYTNETKEGQEILTFPEVLKNFKARLYKNNELQLDEDIFMNISSDTPFVISEDKGQALEDYLSKNNEFTKVAPKTTLLPNTKKIVLVRHAKTQEDLVDRLNGQEPSKLAPEGIKEANMAAIRLKREGITKIYTSPSERAKETSEIIAKRTGIEVENNKGLEAWDLGEFAGIKDNEFPERYFIENPDSLEYNDIKLGESFNQMKDRVVNAYNEIVSKNENGISIITHSKAIELIDALEKYGVWNKEAIKEYFKEGINNGETQSIEPKKIQKTKTINKEAAEEWFKKRFPKVTIKFDSLANMRRMGNDVWGLFQDAIVTIANEASSETIYHEAFHVVSQLYLTPFERSKLYKESYTKYGTPSEQELEQIKQINSRLNKAEVLERYYEEQLADDFMSYMNNSTKINIPVQQKSIFKKILDTINLFLDKIFKREGRLKDINDLFNKIEQGYFDGVVPPSLNIQHLKNTRDFFTKRTVFKKLDGTGNYTLSVEDSLELNKSMTWMFFTELNKIGYSPSDIKVALKESNKIYQSILKVFNDTKQDTLVYNFESIMEAHKLYLSKFNITFDSYDLNQEQETQEDNISESIDLEKENDRIKDSLDIKEACKFSTKDGSPKIIKLLLSSIPVAEVVNGKVTPKKNVFGLPTTEDFNSVWSNIANSLAGSTDYNQMVTKLENMKAKFPYTGVILNRINSIQNIDDQIDLETQFFQAFAKTKNNFIKVIVDDKTGNIYNEDAISDSLKKRIRENLINSFLSEPWINQPIEILQEKFGEIFKAKDLAPKDFLDLLGFKLSNNTIENFKNNKNFEVVINNIKGYIKEELEANTPAYQWFSGKGATEGRPNYKGVLNKLVDFEVPFNSDINELQFINSERETVYAITLNNFLSQVISDEANGKTNGFLRNKYNNNSKWLELLKNAKVTIIDGFKESSEEGTHNSNLKKQDLIAVQVNNLLSNNPVFTLLRTADKKMEYGLSGLPLLDSKDRDYFMYNKEYNSFSFNEDVLNQFWGYFTDETNRVLDSQEISENIKIFDKQSKDYAIFDYLSKELRDLAQTGLTEEVRNRFNEEVSNYLDDYILDTTNLLSDYSIMFKGKGDNWINNGISKEIWKQYDVKEELIAKFVVNDLISKIEQTKLLFGDLAFYNLTSKKKELFKRTPGVIATGKITRVDSKVNEYIKNTNFNHLPTEIKDLWKELSDGVFNVSTFNDISITSTYIKQYYEAIGDLAKPYEEINEADAQGYVHLPAYREFFKRLGEWTPAHENAYQKEVNGEELTSEDKVLFQPVKPMYFGPKIGKDIYTPGYLKLSLMPLIPSVMKSLRSNDNLSTLEKLHDKMLTGGISISVFESGNKVGAENISPLYNEDGYFNYDHSGEMPYSTYDYRYLRLQLDISQKEKKSIIFGTQMRKLLFSNLFGLDSKPEEKIFTDKYNNNNKLSAKELFSEYSQLQNTIVNKEKNKLIKEIGINEDGTIKDAEKLVQILQKEAIGRNSADNILDAIGYLYDPETKELRSTLDIIPAHKKVQNLVMAIINNRLIKQKMNGNSMIQGAVTGYETKARKFDALSEGEIGGIEWIKGSTNVLKFIRGKEENGQISEVLAAEILLPNYLKGKFNGNINELPEDVLELIGYRIPTQGLNSIIHLKVVGFLPESAGSLVIVPSEITAQAGSDFDIDKLNLFIPNTDKQGNKIKYNYGNPEEEQSNAALQNRIMELQRIILSNPSSFNALITPNSAAILEQDAKEIREMYSNGTDKLRIEKETIKKSKQLEFGYGIDTTIRFLSGKSGVGQTALHNAHHVLSQIVGFYINPKRKLNFPYRQDNEGRPSLAGNYDTNNKNTVLDVISAYLNGYVDIAKDDFIVDLGSNTVTADTVFFMLRLGCPYSFVNRFMMQPIVREYIDALQKTEGIIIEKNKWSKNKDLRSLDKEKKQVIEEIRLKYFNALNQEDKGIYQHSEIYTDNTDTLLDSFKDISEEQLNDGITNRSELTAIRAKRQLQILDDFLEYQNMAKQLADVVKSDKDDTQGSGKDMSQANNILWLKQKVFADNFIPNHEDIYSKDNFMSGFANGGPKFSVPFQKGLWTFENNTFKNGIESIKSLLGFQYNIKDIILDKIFSYSTNYAIQTGSNAFSQTELQEIFIGDNSLAKQLAKLKKSDNRLSKNIIIEKYLVPLIANKKGEIDNIKFYNKRLEKYTIDVVTDAFNQIKSAEPNFFDQLIKFDIYQSGLNETPYSFLKYIDGNEYAKRMSNALDNTKKRIVSEGFDKQWFIEQFFKNNSKNKDIVRKVSEKKIITLESEDNGHIANLIKTETKSNYLSHKPFISRRINGVDALYINLGEYDDHTLFTRTEAQGLGFRMTEIAVNRRGTTTIVPTNKVNRFSLLTLLEINGINQEAITPFNWNENIASIEEESKSEIKKEISDKEVNDLIKKCK